MGVAGVVRGEVAQNLHADHVRGVDQSYECFVAAKHRVHPVKAGSVIAVVGPGGEERRQIENVDAQRLQVAEVLDDTVEVPAVELP